MLANIHDVRPLKRLTVPVRDLFMPIFFISFGISINLEKGVIYALFFVLIVWWHCQNGLSDASGAESMA